MAGWRVVLSLRFGVGWGRLGVMRLWIGLAVLGSGLAGGMGMGADEPAEMAGKWRTLSEELPTWSHGATGLRFPVRFGGYVMKGVFDFEAPAGDHLVRYENAELQSRGDVFLVKRDPAPKEKAAVEGAIHEALIEAVDDLFKMAEQGRYDELKEEGSLEGKIEIWKAEAIPLMVQRLSATRIDGKGQEAKRTPMRLWYGSTVFGGYVVTMRHMRPVETGEKGEADMKAFVEGMTRVVKDPALRKEVVPAMEAFVKAPLSESGQEAAKIVLGYLDNSPMVPVLLPAPPLTVWADEMEKLVANSGSQLLRAYVISGALAALNEKDSRSCLTLACQQVVRVYLEIQRLKPEIQHPGFEAMAKAVERGEVAVWFQKEMAAAAK
jgi:hypothetical protein